LCILGRKKEWLRYRSRLACDAHTWRFRSTRFAAATPGFFAYLLLLLFSFVSHFYFYF
jgi:hypothetical protein